MPDFWLLSLALPWVWAALLMGLPRRLDGLSPILALIGAVAAAAGLSASVGLASASGAPDVVARLDWVPELGLSALWIRDGLGTMFGLLTAWIAALVTLFGLRYMPHAQSEAGSSRPLKSFFALLSAFTGAMLGLVTAGTIWQFYFFWELTSVASFLLIGFWHQREDARNGALRSLLLTTAGSLVMLAGLLGLQWGAGTAEWPALLATRASWQEAAWLGPVTLAVLAGALAKSAQFPFPSWLPAAMAAPTPVSAFLHSSTLVAMGVFLLARCFPLLSPAPTWAPVLIGSAILTLIPAGLMALRQSEIKALLAYSTVSQYAFFFLAFGLGGESGAQAALYGFFVHAFIKAGLFLVAGSATYLTGEKRLAAMGGLAKSHPALATLAVILALSLGGVPIFGGFYYKEELLHAAYDQGAWLLLAGMLVGGLLTFLYMLRFLQEVFWGEAPKGLPRARLPLTMLLPTGVLAAASFATGLAPNWANGPILNPAVASVVQARADFVVELHPSAVLLLSLGVMALGLAVWWLWRRTARPYAWLEALPGRFVLGGQRLTALYDALSDRLLDLHDGNLRRYLRFELLAFVGLCAFFWSRFDWNGARFYEPVDVAVTLMLGVSLLAAGATVWLRRHILAVMALSISGYALAVVFMLMHAPGVALAQVLVETLATFSIVLALRQSRLIHPERTCILSAGKREWGRWAIAGACGAGVGWLTLWVGRANPRMPVGAWYGENAEPLAGMHDIVTAILTDFRALDTAIEILVFASAAFAVMGLFRHREHGHD